MSGQTIAIIGGGPGGSSTAEKLSRGWGLGTPGGSKNRVLLFEEKKGWEKPCGGGLTHKVLRRYPYLAKVAGGAKLLHDAEFIAATGAAMTFHLRTPLAIYSRSTFNRLLLNRAEEAGTEVIPERIMDLRRDGSGWELIGREKTYRADFVVLAGGARSRLRTRLTHDFTSDDFMMTFGYYLNVPCELLRVQFYEKFEGYAWAFPRPDHVSVGIGGKMSAGPMPEMRARLHSFMERAGYEPDPERVYSHLLPSLSTEAWHKLELAGPGWALAGDAGGLVDPVTGEGIYYAMRSGEILGEAVLDGQPQTYPKRVAKDFGRSLAQGARIGRLFYHGEFLGASVTTRMIEFGVNNRKFVEIVHDLIEGVQPYGGLFNRLQRVLGRAFLNRSAVKLRKALTFSPASERDAV
jgi:flavin-dependent dehydrogenase